MEEELKDLAIKIDDHERRLKKIEELIQTKDEKDLFRTADEIQDVVTIFKALDLGEFSYIHELSGLALYLAILDIAKQELSVDGLTATEISQICKDKIRVSKGADRTTISHALGEAGAQVDRVDNPRGRGFAYRIMRAGEQFVQESIRKSKAPK